MKASARPFASPPSANLSDGIKIAVTKLLVISITLMITAAERMMVTYKRKDGVQLNGTIYLPPGYKKGERLPPSNVLAFEPTTGALLTSILPPCGWATRP